MQSAGGQRLRRIALQHAGSPSGDHHAPVGLRRLHAQPDERDRRQVDHRVPEQDRALGDDQRDDVGHQVPQADGDRRRSPAPRAPRCTAGRARATPRRAAPGRRRACRRPPAPSAAAVRPAPNTAAASTASRMPGKANRMSSTAETTVSNRPPIQAVAIAISDAQGDRRRDHHQRARASRCGRPPASARSMSSAVHVEAQQVAAGRAHVLRWTGPNCRWGRAAPAPARRWRRPAAITMITTTGSRAMPVAAQPAGGRREQAIGSLEARRCSLGPAPSLTRGSSTRVQQVDDRVDDDERRDQHERDPLHHREVLGLGRAAPGRSRARSG